MELQPEILTHPNIPKPLHGMNPRTIMGKAWWDRERKAVYAAQRHRCLACGIHKKEARYHRWLEAHEFYNIDFEQGRVEFSHLVALCHSCHQFIHSGRLLAVTQKGEMKKSKALEILQHGLMVLQRADKEQMAAAAGYEAIEERDLRPFYVAIYAFHLLKGEPEELAHKYAEEHGFWPEFHAPWSKWRLVLEGQEYASKFADYQEWYSHYNEGRMPPTTLDDFDGIGPSWP